MEVSPELFTISEAAVLLHVPEGWLRKKVSAQCVPHTRLGKHVRFTRDHLEQIVMAGESTAVPLISTTSNGVSSRARRGQMRARDARAVA